MSVPPPLGRGGGWVLVTPQRGIDMPAPGNARGERMQQGNAPEGGKRITAHHYRVAKGVSGIIILLPILGECWWLTCFWPFFLHFVLKASKLERRPYFPQPSTLPSLGVIDEVASLVEEWGWGWVSVPLPWGGVGGGYPVLLSDMQ